MKKLLSLLAAIGLTATASTAVVSCVAIQHLDNPINKDGKVDFKSKTEFLIQKGAQLTEADSDYYYVKNSDLGDPVSKDGIHGVDVLRSIEVVDPTGNTKVPGANDIPTSAWKIQEEQAGGTQVFRVKKDDVKGSLDKDNKLTKQVTAYMDITFDAKANGLWYKYYSQEMSWSVVSYNEKGQIDTYAEAFNFTIPETDKPVISGVGAVDKTNKTVTIQARNLFKASQSDLDGLTLTKGGQPVSGAKFKAFNGSLQITLTSADAGVYSVSYPQDSYGFYDGTIYGNATFTID